MTNAMQFVAAVRANPTPITSADVIAAGGSKIKSDDCRLLFFAMPDGSRIVLTRTTIRACPAP